MEPTRFGGPPASVLSDRGRSDARRENPSSIRSKKHHGPLAPLRRCSSASVLSQASDENMQKTCHFDTGNSWCLYVIYIYIYTPKPGRSPTRQYGVLSCFFPSRPASDFFVRFQEAFSSCGSSQSSASGWKAFEGLTEHVPAEQATRYSLSAVSTSKSPGQRCSLAAASTWTRFFREEATKRPTLFIRLRLPLMAPKRLSALLSPPATKKQRLVSFTRPCRRFACCSRVLAWELGKDPFQSFTVGVKILVKCDTPFKWIFSIFEAALLKAGDPSAATIVSFCRDRRRAGRTSDVLSAPPAPRLPCVFLSLTPTTDQPLFNRLSMTCILPANVRFFPSFLAPNCAVSVSTMSLRKVICCAWTYSWRSKSSNQSRIGESFESGIRNVEQKRKHVWTLEIFKYPFASESCSTQSFFPFDWVALLPVPLFISMCKPISFSGFSRTSRHLPYWGFNCHKFPPKKLYAPATPKRPSCKSTSDQCASDKTASFRHAFATGVLPNHCSLCSLVHKHSEEPSANHCQPHPCKTGAKACNTQHYSAPLTFGNFSSHNETNLCQESTA